MPDPAAPTVLVEDHDRVRRITLQRPPTNALSRREYADLEIAFQNPAKCAVRVLRARGTVFCSGQDIEEAAGMPPDEMAAHLIASGAAIAAAARSPIPLVSVVNGPALGAGALLIALSDVVIMADSAWLSFPEVRHGLPLGLSLLSRLVPPRLARHLMSSGSRISAHRLSAVGAVDHLVPLADLDRVADDAAQKLRVLPVEMSTWLYDTPERSRRAEEYLDELRQTTSARSWTF